ncbi:hypothetical protein ACI3LX_003614 [Candidozyma auris]|uniref:Uncharacterized protein n=1 Tax=Candidozyma auris TaxID=498019 RepID=A0A0L0P6K6_CANAR|nr:hypothetical protein QG37_01213 [[Candida] auris]
MLQWIAATVLWPGKGDCSYARAGACVAVAKPYCCPGLSTPLFREEEAYVQLSVGVLPGHLWVRVMRSDVLGWGLILMPPLVGPIGLRFFTV